MKRVEDNKPKANKKRKSRLITVMLGALLLVGIGIMAYPTASDWWNLRQQNRMITGYDIAAEDIEAEASEAMLRAAQEYNRSLLQKTDPYTLDEAEAAEYESLLDISGTGIMGYVRIPSIDVNLPVYHGTDEEVVKVAIGHIAGSSLPVGGKSTHAVLSGHRGLPSAKLFTDLDKVKMGDIFTVTVLDQVCTYEVDQILVALPEDMGELQIEPGKDYCTLMTCTPYGVNTHRLLVRGHRIEDIPTVQASELKEVTEDEQLPTGDLIAAAAVPLATVGLAAVLLIQHRRRRRRSGNKPPVRLGPSIACAVAGAFVMLSVVGTAALLTVPRYQGYEVYCAADEAMSPEIPKGSAVYVEQVEPESVEEADVIVCLITGEAEIRRVKENRFIIGEFTVASDAWPGENTTSIPYVALTGRVVKHVPVIGRGLSAWSTSVGRVYVAALFACGVMLEIIAVQLRGKRQKCDTAASQKVE